MADLPHDLSAQLAQAVLSHADESAASIYQRFGLAQRGILLGTFQKYVSRIRREAAGERMNTVLEDIGTEPPTWEEIDSMARREAVRKLMAGDAKIYEIALLSKGRREHDKLEMEKQAETRAMELHAEKMRELRKAQEAALKKTSESANLSPEQVREIRLKVLGIAE